jgi:hypothetical protein
MTHRVVVTMLHMSNTEFLFTFICTFKEHRESMVFKEILGCSFQPYQLRSGVLSFMHTVEFLLLRYFGENLRL